MCKKVFILAVLGLMAVHSVQAIAVADYATAEDSPMAEGYTLDWKYIYKYKGSSSVAVDHYWILTAAHVADDGGSGVIAIAGEMFTPVETVYHDTADLALVRFDTPFPGYYLPHEDKIYTESMNKASYDLLLIAGYGYTGSVSETSFTQSGGAGTKRWGTNRGTDIWLNQLTKVTDYEFKIDIDPTSNVVLKYTQCFYMSFNTNNTPYEAGGNVHDSGSPVFIKDGSVWKLAGLNLLRRGSGPFTGNYAALIPDYADWIIGTIPDYDTDMDGLPDHWEDSTGETQPGLDPDQDDFTNYDEWIADTDPTLGSSILELGEYTNASYLAFNSSADRQYIIEYCESLTNQNWQTKVDWFNASGTQTVQAVSTAGSNRFYRVRVKLP